MNAEALRVPSASDVASDLATGLVAERFGPGTVARDRNFWIALAVASLLHGSLFLGLLGHKPKEIGDDSGRDDGISISVVTEADIRSESSVSEPPPGSPGAPAQAQPPPPPPLPEAKSPEPLPPEPAAPEPEPVEPPKAEAPPDAAPPELKPSIDVAKAISEEVPDLLALPGEGAAPAKKEAPKAEKLQEKKPEAAPPKPQQQQAKPQPQKKTASLDLAPPAAFTGSAGGGGRSAGFERPPGITKSGANDAFARAVIRALQGTMPQLREIHGRVTVRIILNDNGNVESVQVVRPSTVGSLDQSVVFATKQTSYPFPPPNSNTADRTFLVTYIYR